MGRPRMAWIVTLAEALSGSFGAVCLALGGIAVATADLWRHFRAG